MEPSPKSIPSGQSGLDSPVRPERPRRIGGPRWYRWWSYAGALLILAAAVYSLHSRGWELAPFHAGVLCLSVTVAVILSVLPGYLEFIFRMRQLRPRHPESERYLREMAVHLNETRAAILHVQEQSDAVEAWARETGAGEELDEVIVGLELRIGELERILAEKRDADAPGESAPEPEKPLEIPEGGFLAKALGANQPGTEGGAVRRVVENGAGKKT